MSLSHLRISSLSSNGSGSDNLDGESYDSHVKGGANLTINTSRMQRKVIHDFSQTYITDYCKVLHDIETLVRETFQITQTVWY